MTVIALCSNDDSCEMCNGECNYCFAFEQYFGVQLKCHHTVIQRHERPSKEDLIKILMKSSNDS